jgi:flavin-binding protein dodecin
MEDAVVADFILRAIADSAAGRRVPPGKGKARSAYEEAFAPYRNRRVLIIHRDHYYPRKDSDRTPGPDYFLESAIEAGLDARVIRSDFACAVPAAAEPLTAAAEEAAIRETIETWKPEVIVYDAFGGAGRESMTECIRDLRRHQKFQVVGLFHDVWSDAIREAISRAEGDLDTVWFFDPVATSPQLQGVIRGVATVPPIPERPFREARQRTTPTRNLGFMGSISISNHIRGLWLMEMRRRGIPIDVVTGFPFSPEAYRTIDGFAGFLASCKVSLCICGRNSEEAAIPARIWEGIFAKSVLLEDDTPHVRHLLTPFAHYVPFRTIDELAFYADFLARRDDIREVIATHALEFVREAYPAVRIWHAVLETATKARQP